LFYKTSLRTRVPALKKRLPLLSALLFFAALLPAQTTVNLRGFCRDADSREALPSGYVYELNGGRGTNLNAYGYYQVQLPTGPARLIVGAVGYRTDTLELDLTDNRQLDLTLRALTMTTIEVTAQRGGPPTPGRESISMERLRDVPALFGEPDPLRALTILPGISGGVDGQVGLNVRGGSPDQNLLLMDGATVYNGGHLFGFLSVFNPAAVSSVDVYKGYVPGRYNGRASSVIDVSIREGARDRHRKSASFGLINSNLLLEGPLNKAKTASYLVSGRMAHTVVPTTIYSLIAPEDMRILAGMYDFNAKFSWDLPKSARLTLSFYAGDDLLRGSSTFDGTKEFVNINYGNRTLTGRYFRPLSGKLSSVSTLIANRYVSGLTAGSDDLRIDEKIRFQNRNAITEYKADQRLVYSLPRGEVSLGVNATYRDMEPVRLRQETNGERFESLRVNFRPLLASAYLESNFRFGRRLSVTADLHRSYYRLGGEGAYTFGGWEPRAGVGLKLGKRFDLTAGFSRLYQNIHQTRTVGVDVSYESWLPVVAGLPEQASLLYSFGADWRPNKYLSLAAEVYRKTLSGQIAVPGYGFALTGRESGEWSTRLLGEGTGEAYGLELQGRYQRGEVDLNVAYTYARSFRRFAAINGGRRYPYRFDRPHDLAVNLGWRPGKRWGFNANFVLQSGAAFTLPTAFVRDIYGEEGPVYEARNNARLPLYHRLDLTASKYFKTRKRGREARLDFSLYNTYAQPNASFINTQLDVTYLPDFSAVTSRFLTFRRGSVFSVLPSINYSLKW